MLKICRIDGLFVKNGVSVGKTSVNNFDKIMHILGIFKEVATSSGSSIRKH